MARSLVQYGPVIGTLLSRLKYQGDMSVGPGILVLASDADLSVFTSCSLIVPVPLHRQRLQQRGFNQALYLAKLFFAKRGVRIDPRLLQKVVQTPVQTGLSGGERRRNLRHAFAVSPSHQVSDRTICLVDDVYTTGTTAEQCSRVLLAAGAAEVRVLTLARSMF